MKQGTLNTVAIIVLTIILAVPAAMGCYYTFYMGSGAQHTTTNAVLADTLQQQLFSEIDSLTK